MSDTSTPGCFGCLSVFALAITVLCLFCLFFAETVKEHLLFMGGAAIWSYFTSLLFNQYKKEREMEGRPLTANNMVKDSIKGIAKILLNILGWLVLFAFCVIQIEGEANVFMLIFCFVLSIIAFLILKYNKR